MELWQIYSSARRSHHPNNTPRPAIPNANYRAEEPDPLLPAAEAVGEGSGDNRRWRWGDKTNRLPNQLSPAARSNGVRQTRIYSYMRTCELFDVPMRIYTIKFLYRKYLYHPMQKKSICIIGTTFFFFEKGFFFLLLENKIRKQRPYPSIP